MISSAAEGNPWSTARSPGTRWCWPDAPNARTRFRRAPSGGARPSIVRCRRGTPARRRSSETGCGEARGGARGRDLPGTGTTMPRPRPSSGRSPSTIDDSRSSSPCRTDRNVVASGTDAPRKVLVLGRADTHGDGPYLHFLSGWSGRSRQQQSGSSQRSTTLPASTRQPHSAQRTSICLYCPSGNRKRVRHKVPVWRPWAPNGGGGTFSGGFGGLLGPRMSVPAGHPTGTRADRAKMAPDVTADRCAGGRRCRPKRWSA